MASIDLSKLTPETWVEGASGNCNVVYFDGDDIRGVAAIRRPVDREFVLLARRAFGVMMRRGWHPVSSGDPADHLAGKGWMVDLGNERFFNAGQFTSAIMFADPFTALCAAEDWLLAQEGNAHE